LLYQRSGSNWNYVGLLGPAAELKEWNAFGLAMKGGVAMTFIDQPRVFERSGTQWVQAPLAPAAAASLTGPDIEIDGGRILVPRAGCNVEAVVLRKINGTWDTEGQFSGNPTYCGSLGWQQDLRAGRAIVYNNESPSGQPPTQLRLYKLTPEGTWQQFLTSTLHANLGTGGVQNRVAINWPYYAQGGNRQFGGSVGYALNGMAQLSPFRLQPADAFRVPYDQDPYMMEHLGPNLFAEDYWSVDRQARVVHVFRVNDDELHSNDHVATLQSSNGESLGFRLKYNGSRIIVNGFSNNNTVRVFSLPTSLDAPPVQVHDFESASSGAAWQPTAGSSFTLATSGNSRVYRQAITPGLSSSFLPEVWTNQSIQALVALNSVNCADCWAGLATRRTDDSNYYYVTLRASGSVQLRRMVNGVFTPMASVNTPVVLGRKYHLRLESIGTLHKVYLDYVEVLAARDSALSSGTAGVIAFRAAADYDNVILSPSPYTTIYRVLNNDDFDIDDWTFQGGSWDSLAGGVMRQNSTAGIAARITGAITEDQIVQAKIKPTAFATPDTWVGLAARYLDDRNYLYVTLRGNGVVSLWRRTNGAITQLATRRMPVTVGQWHKVRLEIVNNVTRVLVNEQLMLSTSADPGPAAPGRTDQKSRVGLITNRASAEFDDFLAYQP
jgi:hypothetical protein